MKRILSLLLVLVMLFAVCACDKDKKDGEEAESADTYTGVINGDQCVLTLDGNVATIKITKEYRQNGLNHKYVSTLTTTFTKEDDTIVLDFTKEGSKGLVQFTLSGDGEARAAYLEILKGLSYKSDPTYLEFCDGKEVEALPGSVVWGAVGLRDTLTLTLNNDKTFTWNY